MSWLSCTPRKERPDTDPRELESEMNEQLTMQTDIAELKTQIQKLTEAGNDKDVVISTIREEMVELKTMVSDLKKQEQATMTSEGPLRNMAGELEEMREELDAMNAEVAILHTQSQVQTSSNPNLTVIAGTSCRPT